jgi:hypothetical protein
MEDESRGMRLVLAGVLTAIVVGGTADLVLDAPTDWLSGHVLYELALIVGGAMLAIVKFLPTTRGTPAPPQ